jgi:hypothetical protein
LKPELAGAGDRFVEHFHALFLLEISLHLRRSRTFLLDTSKESFQIRRRKRFGAEEGRDEEEHQANGETDVTSCAEMIMHFQFL